MITKLSLSNFKSFIASGDIELRPVTILSGQNSSGKSTLIQVLLMLKQTLDSPMFNEALVLNGSLVSLGTYRDVLNHVADDMDGFKLKVGFNVNNSDGTEAKLRRYGAPDHSGSVGLELGFNDLSGADGYSKSPELVSCVLDGKMEHNQGFSIRFTRNPNLLETLASKYNLLDSKIQLDGRALYTTDRVKGFVSPPVGVAFSSFLPNAILTPHHKQRIDAQERFLFDMVRYLATSLVQDETGIKHILDTVSESARVKRWEFTITRLSTRAGYGRRVHSQPGEHRTSLSYTPTSAIQPWVNDEEVNVYLDIIDRIMVDRTELRDVEIRDRLASTIAFLHSSERSRFRDLLLSYLGIVQETESLPKMLRYQSVRRWTSSADSQWDLDDILELVVFSLRRVYYLGPLREAPRAYYRRVGSNDPLYVGQQGENAAFVLKYYADRLVSVVLPPDDNVTAWNPYNSIIAECPLGVAVQKWLNYVGVAQEVRIEEMSKFGLSIRARIHGSAEADLTNVGVGVSQVLPLIVLGLASPENAILLCEQPELHLHPYVQSRLGDFFIALAHMGKQVIAETHSEHLVHRMRLHAALGNVDPTTDFAVYFCSVADGSSTIDRVEIDEYGSIDNWPDGFFDETTKQLDQLLTAALKRAELRFGQED